MKILKSLVLASAAAAAMNAHATDLIDGVSFVIPTGGGGTVGVVKQKGDGKELRLDLGLNLSKPAGGSTVFGLSGEVGFRKYFAEAGKVKAYHQPGGFVAIGDFADFAQQLSIGVSYAVGAEFMVTPNFSFGARGVLSFNLKDEFKTFAFKTGTSQITGTLYW